MACRASAIPYDEVVAGRARTASTGRGACSHWAGVGVRAEVLVSVVAQHPDRQRGWFSAIRTTGYASPRPAPRMRGPGMLELETLKLSTAVARSIRAGRWGAA
jgi:hypothetical protein